MKRVLSEAEANEASLLRAAWEALKWETRGLTQAGMAEQAGLGTQGAFGQYLRGVIPLNLEALVKICLVLEIDPISISPRLYAKVIKLESMLNRGKDTQ